MVIEPTFEVAEYGRWAVMRVTGEIDMATAPRLRQHVLNVTARGASLAEAHARAYAMVDKLDWPDGFCRRDIGWRAL